MKIHAITHTSEISSKKDRNSSSKALSLQRLKKDPLLAQKEYIRALNATKIERLLAKPFVRNFDCFSEGVTHLDTFDNLAVSASYDGNVSIFRGEEQIFLANTENLKNISLKDDKLYFSIDDKFFFIQFNYEEAEINKNLFDSIFKSFNKFENKNIQIEQICELQEKINDFYNKNENLYALTDNYCRIFNDEYRNIGQIDFQDNYRQIYENNQILFCPSDRNLDLFDERSHEKIISKQFGIRTNDIAFKDSKYFISANEDSFAYLHDIRRVEQPIAKFIGHVNSILSVDIIGNELITGSADKSIRIFNAFERTSRDVYYNKRMLSVNKVKIYKKKYILSGSDDGNVRLWRLNASHKENSSFSERQKLEENKILKEKFYNIGDVKRIDKHRFLPGELKGRIRNEMEHYKAVQRRKIKNKKRFEGE